MEAQLHSSIHTHACLLYLFKNASCRAKVEALQRQYVESTKGLASQLVLFEDALLHLTRICRSAKHCTSQCGDL